MVWELLASTKLTSPSDTIDSGTITAKKFLYVEMFGISTGLLSTNMRFNGSSASDYAWRCQRDGGTDDVAASQTEIAFGGGANVFLYCYIFNNADEEKLLVGEKMSTVSGAGAGNAPDRREQVGKWANTSDSITSIQALNAAGGDYESGSEITVYGTD